MPPTTAPIAQNVELSVSMNGPAQVKVYRKVIGTPSWSMLEKRHNSDLVSMIEQPGRVIPSRDITEAGIPRDRAQRACLNCAAQKLKCSGEDGCQRCAQNELVCQYPDTKRASKQRAVKSRQAISRHSQRRMQPPSAVNDQPTPGEKTPQDQDSGLASESQKGKSITRQTTPSQTIE